MLAQQAAGNYTLKNLSVPVRVGLWPIKSTLSGIFLLLTNLIVFGRVPVAKEIIRLGHLNDDLARHQPADAC